MGSNCGQQGGISKETGQILEENKKMIKARFLPHDYERTLYQSYHKYRQGSRPVREYTEEFQRFSSRNNFGETEEQLIARYASGLSKDAACVTK